MGRASSTQQVPVAADDARRWITSGGAPSFAGRLASTPVAHVPAVSLSSSPGWWFELSRYWPTAPQLPADAHDTELRKTAGFAPAFAGRLVSTPLAHDAANASDDCTANANSTPHAS